MKSLHRIRTPERNLGGTGFIRVLPLSILFFAGVVYADETVVPNAQELSEGNSNNCIP